MPVAALLLFLPLLTSFIGAAGRTAKNVNDGKYNNLLVWLLAALGVYILVKGWNTSKQEAYLNNAGSDKPTQQAQALRTAMNTTGSSWTMKGDGTDEDLIMSVAAEITDYAAVSDAYQVLYGSNLTSDLQSELDNSDLQKFYSILNRKPGTTPTTSTSSGKSVVAIQTVNLRKFESYLTVDKQAKTGELIGKYVSELDLTINNKKSRFVIVEATKYLITTVKYYVLKSAIKLV